MIITILIKTLVGNSQFPSRHKSDQPDQLPRFRHRDNTDLHTQYGEVKAYGYGNYSGVGQFLPHHYRCNPGQGDQSPVGDHTHKGGSRGKPEDRREINTLRRDLPVRDYTPRRTGTSVPRRKLYENLEMDQGETCDEDIEVVPLDTDLEVLLINSCKIDAVKVQTIIDGFMTDRDYATIFCMTETKVEGHDFQPEG